MMVNVNQTRAKLLLAFASITVILFFAYKTEAQEWHVTDQATIAWDAVTTLEDGQPILEPPTYKVWRKVAGSADKELVASGIVETQNTIAFAAEGSYFVGVSAVRLLAEGLEIEGAIAWSDDPEATGGNPFGIRHYIPPAMPRNLTQQ